MEGWKIAVLFLPSRIVSQVKVYPGISGDQGSNSGDTCYINTFDRVPWSILKIPDMSTVQYFRKCGTYRARLKPGGNSWDYRLKASIELQRSLLRVISRLAGFCLIWPGAWAIIGISNTFYPGALAWPYLTGLRCGLRL